MESIVWAQCFSVGNVIIDAEHRNLMRMVNEAVRAVAARDCLTLLQELEHLENWLHTHCAHEETIAQSVNFPICLLRSAQQYSQGALRHLRDEMESRYGLWSDDTAAYLANLLKSWIIGHIAAVDMPMKHLLQRHDYNFWPGYTEKSAYGPLPATRGANKPRCGCDSFLPATK